MIAIERKRRLATTQIALTKKWGQIYLHSHQNPTHCLTTTPHTGFLAGIKAPRRSRIQAPQPNASIRTPRITKPIALKNSPTKKPQVFRPGAFSSVSGAPGGIRTHDPCLRRAVLYPAELRMLVRATSYPCRPDASIPAFSPVTVGRFPPKMANRHSHSQLPAPHVPLFALLLWL